MKIQSDLVRLRVQLKWAFRLTVLPSINPLEEYGAGGTLRKDKCEGVIREEVRMWRNNIGGSGHHDSSHSSSLRSPLGQLYASFLKNIAYEQVFFALEHAVERGSFSKGLAYSQCIQSLTETEPVREGELREAKVDLSLISERPRNLLPRLFRQPGHKPRKTILPDIVRQEDIQGELPAGIGNLHHPVTLPLGIAEVIGCRHHVNLDGVKAYCPVDFGTVRGCDARVWSAFNILTGGWFSYYDAEGNAVTKDASDFLDYAMGYDLDGDLPLFVYPREKVSVKAVADVMRDHYEGTPMDMTQDIGAGGNALPYRWRPMEFKAGDATYLNERAIATQQTGFWMVGQARDYVPDEVGGILWFGTDDAATSYVTPIYTSTTKVPECFRVGNGDLLHYSPTASFWLNNRVANACYKMYNVMAAHVRAKIDAFEIDQMERKTHSVDSAAVVLYNSVVVKMQDKLSSEKKTVMMSRKPFAKVIRYVTDYTVKTAQDQFAAWAALEEELLVKFIDGNVKPQNADGSFKHSEYSEGQPEKIDWPGYTELWKETVAREAGEVLKVKE